MHALIATLPSSHRSGRLCHIAMDRHGLIRGMPGCGKTMLLAFLGHQGLSQGAQVQYWPHRERHDQVYAHLIAEIGHRQQRQPDSELAIWLLDDVAPTLEPSWIPILRAAAQVQIAIWITCLSGTAWSVVTPCLIPNQLDACSTTRLSPHPDPARTSLASDWIVTSPTAQHRHQGYLPDMDARVVQAWLTAWQPPAYHCTGTHGSQQQGESTTRGTQTRACALQT